MQRLSRFITWTSNGELTCEMKGLNPARVKAMEVTTIILSFPVDFRLQIPGSLLLNLVCRLRDYILTMRGFSLDRGES